MDDMLVIIESPFFIRALIGTLLSALVASSVGPLLVSRGITFLAAEVSHAALGGAALGVLLDSLGLIRNVDPLIFAFTFGLISGLITAYAGEKGVIEKMESAIGVALAMSMSLAVLFLGMIRSEYMPKVWGYLIGDLLLLTNWDLTSLGIATLITVTSYMMFHREFMYIAFDMEGAEALGLRVKIYHYLSIMIASLGVVVATKALGAILVYAFMIAPAAAANEISKTTSQLSMLTLMIVVVSGTVGLFSSFYMDFPPSGIIGLLTTTSYIIALISKRRHS